jgi:hypothetical protein
VSAAWVQLAGVSLTQTVNTMSMVLAMCTESPIVDEYGLDLGLTRIFTAGGGRLEPITASASTAEGARPTFIVEDETHWWTDTNGGLALDKVNRRNLAKSRDGSARMLETTNAHVPGESSVAERSFDAWAAKEGGGGLLYDSLEAPPDVDLADPRQLHDALVAARGDSVWVDLERVEDEIYDPSTPPAEARRFYLNQLTHATDSWLSQPEWAARARVDVVVADRTPITLGFDGSRSRARGITDATALVGCTLDGHVFELRVWEQGPNETDWHVPVHEVDAAVRLAFSTYDVVGFYADPAKWESWVAQWEAAYSSKLRVKASRDHPCEWWMTGGRSGLVVRALEQFHSAVLDGDMTHDGSFNLTRHVLNARRHPTRSGMQIRKEHPDSARKIDAAVAAVLAWQARLDAVAMGTGPAQFVPRRIR